MIKVLLSCGAGIAMAFVIQTAVAQGVDNAGYPSTAVRMVLGTTPGGGADLQARMFAQLMAESIGQAFIVENRPGAAQEIAHVYVAKAAADGYTILLASPAFTFLPSLTGRNSYDPVKQFAPVIQLSQSPYVFYVNPTVPVSSLGEYISYVRANPGKVNIGVVGPGGFTHLAAAWFHNAANLRVVYVPYKGTGPILGEVGAGRLQGAFGNPLSVLPHVKAGKLKLLAVSTARRAKAMPDLATIAEQGVPDYNLSTWQAILAPAATSQAVVNKLNREFDKVVNHPAVVSKLRQDGSEPVGGAPEVLRRLVVSEVKRWGDIIPAVGLGKK